MMYSYTPDIISTHTHTHTHTNTNTHKHTHTHTRTDLVTKIFILLRLTFTDDALNINTSRPRSQL